MENEMEKNAQLSRRNFLGKLTTVTAGLAISGITASGKNKSSLVIPQNSNPAQWVQTSDKKIRIGVVGGGFGASFFWHQHPNCIVEAVSDLQ